jgi:glycosyltransferase involved in cell wall biosynthesis
MRWAFVDVEIARLQGQCKADLGYAYWKSGCAYPVARLKESGSINEVIARAHHHDLYPNLSPEGYNPFDDYLKCQLDCVYSISNDGIDTLKEIGYRNDQMHLSRLGVAKPERLAASSTDGVLRLISVSRVEHIKRLDLLVAALKLAPSSMRIEWTHFGTGTQFSAIEESLRSLPTNVSAHLQGEVRNVEVLAHYLNQPVDILINVSASEGVPVSIMEALSFGVPCIATDVGATREIVNTKNGSLLNENVTAAEVMDAVIDLERRIEYGESLQSQALGIWDEHFNRDKNFIDFAEQISK